MRQEKNPLPQLVKLFATIYNPLPQFHGDGTPRSPASGTIVKYEVTYPAGVWNSLHNARAHTHYVTPRLLPNTYREISSGPGKKLTIQPRQEWLQLHS